MKRVSIRQAIIDAIEDGDPDIGRYQNQALKWAKKAEKGIGSALGYKIKAKTINVTGSYLALPDDCYEVVGVYPGDYEDEANLQYQHVADVNVAVDERAGEDVYDRDLTMYWKPMEVDWIDENHYEEMGDELHLIGDFEGQDFTLVYKYNETDISGDWFVNESHIPALSLYIQYMFAKKYTWKFFKSDKLYRASHGQFVLQLERQYNLEVRNARAEDGNSTRTTL